MSRNDVNAALCAILTTLREVGEPAPESSIYMALGMDIDKYHALRTIMLNCKLVSLSSHALSLTPEGVAMADKINAHVAAQGASP